MIKRDHYPNLSCPSSSSSRENFKKKRTARNNQNTGTNGFKEDITRNQAPYDPLTIPCKHYTIANIKCVAKPEK
jgi:uncharacterized protein (UPF0333 family)